MSDDPPGPNAGRELFEAMGTPNKFSARVVQPGAAPRVHGYGVDDDLARHHSSGSVVYLCLTGELPEPPLARRFERAMICLAPVHVGEAPAHVAVLSRVVGSSVGGLLSTAAAAAAEEARTEIEAHQELFAWLARGAGPLPSQYVEPPCARVPLMLAGMDAEQLLPTAPRTAALGLLWLSGITDPERIAAAMFLARLPCAIAEGLAQPHRGSYTYPILRPEIRYVAPEKR